MPMYIIQTQLGGLVSHQRTFDRLTDKINRIEQELQKLDPKCPFSKHKKSKLIRTKIYFEQKLKICLEYKPNSKQNNLKLV